MKVRPVSVKPSEESSLTVSATDVLDTELARLLRDEKVGSEVVIDWIDVSALFTFAIIVMSRHYII